MVLSRRICVDRLDWYPEEDLYEIKRKQLSALATWLLKHDLVEEIARDYYKVPLDSDFRLFMYDLTRKGRKILDRCYEKWVGELSKDMTVFENALKEIENK